VTPDGAPQESARHWAREIVTGHISPIEGARRIVAGAGALEPDDELMVFAGLVGDWEEDEAGRPDCEARIMDEAGMLLADTA
jgi:hypothetical protein